MVATRSEPSSALQLDQLDNTTVLNIKLDQSLSFLNASSIIIFNRVQTL